MDRKNMALILSIFLFIGLLFSVDYLEQQSCWNYDEPHQVYSVNTGMTTSVGAVKQVRRTIPLLISCLFSVCGILCGRTQRWESLRLKKAEMLYFLKQVRVSQRMDGKKRKATIKNRS